MPGFVDCHTHVISFLLAGLRSKFDTVKSGPSNGPGNGVKERHIRTMNVIANDKHALSLFTTYVVNIHNTRLMSAWEFWHWLRLF